MFARSSHARRRASLRFAVLAALAVAVIGAASLPAFAAATSGPAKVHVVTNAKLGHMLVGPNGHTLYIFLKDTGPKSTCYGTCAKYWPPLLTQGKPVALAGAKQALLGTTKRTNGTVQVTYDKKPLYYFLEDKKPGDTKGEGLNLSGAKWYAIGPGGGKIDKG